MVLTSCRKALLLTLSVTGLASFTSAASAATAAATVGQQVSFSVTAAGSAPFSYQWTKNGSPITGATGAAYTINPVATSSAGTYAVQVANAAGAITAPGATLTVAAAATAPTISTQPAGVSISAGSSATFSVTAAGTGPLSYQWRKNGTAIAGATSASHTIAAATTADAGTFSVVVNNSVGSVTSVGAVLSVSAPVAAPAITQQPASVTVTSGQPASFSVTATGTGPLSYQWRKDGTAITGATGAAYSVASAASTSAGTYSVVVRNSVGSVTSANATLTVNPANASGLVAAYGCDEGTGTTLKDLSGNGNNGVLSGARWTTSGRYRGGLSFNGASSLVTVNDSASLDLTAGMTLEAWINASKPGGGRDVLYKGGNVYFLMLSSTTYNRPATGGTYSSATLNGPSALSRNVWAHLAATYDGTTVRLFVNGKQVASRAQTGSIRTSTGALTIGGDTAVGRFFEGRIDEIRIYNRALSATELQANMKVSVVNSLASSTVQTLAAQTTTLDSTASTTLAATDSTGTSATDTTTTVIEPATLDSVSSRVVLPAGTNSARTTFVVDGSTPQTMLIRGCGPALTSFGVTNALATPLLRLTNSAGTELARNSGWTQANADAIRSAALTLGAFALPEDGRDAALLTTLDPGTYTVRLSDVNQAGGAGLLEVFPVDPADLHQPTARAVVASGANLVSGFTVGGNTPVQVLVRAVGPSLTTSATVLAHPSLKLVSAAGAVLATNQGWNQASNAAAITTVTQQLGATALPAGSADCAVLVTLAPGSYSADVGSADAGSGTVQLEVYLLPTATP